MNSIAPIKPSHPARLDGPTFWDRVAEYMPWIGFVFVAGPPVFFLAAPLLVLVLGLIWPFALLFTVAAACIAVMTAVGLAGMLLALPYLVTRRVRAHRMVRAQVSEPAAALVAVESPRAIA